MPRIGGVSSAGHRSWTGTTRHVPMAGGGPHLAGLAHELILHVGSAVGERRPSQKNQVGERRRRRRVAPGEQGAGDQ